MEESCYPGPPPGPPIPVSASAPDLKGNGKVLEDSDYDLPKYGRGLTGHPPRILLGTYSKDKGEFSSRINQIIRAAKFTPGPGSYLKHGAWGEPGRTGGTRRVDENIKGFGNKFANSSRDYKPMNKTPEPGKYERSDIFTHSCISSQENLSKNPRLKLGIIAKGPRRSFLDAAIAKGAASPAPGNPFEKNVQRNTMNRHLSAPNFEIKTTDRRGDTKPPLAPGPNHYSINYSPTESKVQVFPVPKDPVSNFIEKNVRTTMLPTSDPKKKIPCPGPGYPETLPTDKVTRGTKYLQLRGLGRNPVSGYM